MRILKPLEIGLMFWAKDDPRETLREVKAFGVSAGQLGIPGDLNIQDKVGAWQQALEEEDFVTVTAVCSYTGEDYADQPTVLRTVGLVPLHTRSERIERTKEVADFAHAIGIQSVACHIGFVPHDRADPLYLEIMQVARDICEYCGERGQTFTLETGQEPANVLDQFIADVGCENLKINFDPANMILYGTGNPIEALRVLIPHVISVHCKDGDWPATTDMHALGKERPLGQGSVNIPKFVQTLKEVGYTGILSLEREELNAEQRAADIRSGIALLKRLV